MDIERAKGILKEACMNYTEFSKLMGVKPITVRLAFSGKRLSKKMVIQLEDMEASQVEEKEKSERVIIKEGMKIPPPVAMILERDVSISPLSTLDSRLRNPSSPSISNIH